MFRSPFARVVGVLALGVALVVGVVAVVSGGDDDGSAAPVDASSTVYLRRSLAPAVAAVRHERGRGARLIDVGLSARGAAFRLIAGERVSGSLAQPPDYGAPKPFQVGVSRKLLATMAPFPISIVDPAVPERLVRRIKHRYRARQFKLILITLRKRSGSQPQWTVEGQADGQRVLYTAAVDGSKPKPDRRVVEENRARRRTEARAKRDPSLRKTLRDARAISKCIEEAQGNQKTIQQCNRKVLGK